MKRTPTGRCSITVQPRLIVDGARFNVAAIARMLVPERIKSAMRIRSSSDRNRGEDTRGRLKSAIGG